MQKLRNRITYANVVATIALFVALGGVSYAAVKLPKNSVGAKQLKKNSVVSSKVKNGTLTLSDFKSSQRSKLRGPKGATGATGAQGPAGISGLEILQSVTPEEVSAFKTEEVSCSPGKKALGGGASVESATEGYEYVAIDQSGPRAGGTGWIASAHEHEEKSEPWALQVFVICGLTN